MTVPKDILFYLSVVSLISFASAAKILCIYPIPFHSHHSVFNTITEELVRRGHELVVVTPGPLNKNLPNLTEIDIREFSYNTFDTIFNDYQKKHGMAIDPIGHWAGIAHPAMTKVMRGIILHPEMQALIKDKNQHFDVIVTEAAVASNVALVARFNSPVILVSSFMGGENTFITLGAPVHPILFPEFSLPQTWRHSFWEKLSTIVLDVRLRYYDWQTEAASTSMVKELFGENAPSYGELKKNIQMMLLNCHHIWDNNRPVPPSVIYMGALHLKEPKPLPKKLQSYLDSSRNGVVYMSFGSKVMFSDLPPETIKVFLKVFGTLPYDVLIKWNGGEMPDKPANVRLEEWLPQGDLFHHPSLKLFLTHGGLQSADEAITARVPMIGFPCFGDQFYNVQRYEQLGIGKQLDYAVTEDQLREAILSVAEEKSYRDNIDGLARIMEQQRAGGLDRAMFWIDYVAKYGGEQLRSPLSTASLVDYFMLDVLAFVASVVLVAILVLVGGIRLLLRSIFSSDTMSKKSSKGTKKLKSN